MCALAVSTVALLGLLGEHLGCFHQPGTLTGCADLSARQPLDSANIGAANPRGRSRCPFCAVVEAAKPFSGWLQKPLYPNHSFLTNLCQCFPPFAGA